MSTHTLEVAAGDVRPHQHHPRAADHRPRHGGRAARAGRRRGRAAHAGVPEAHRRQRASRRSTRLCDAPAAFPYLLLPGLLGGAQPRAAARAGRRRARRALRRHRGSWSAASIFAIVFWLTWQLLDYEELGDYLIRLGLSWLFLTFLSFLAFSALVTALSTFFLSEDLRLLLAAPVAAAPALLLALRARPSARPSWMVVAFLLPGPAGRRASPAARGRPTTLTARPDRRALRHDPGGARAALVTLCS